MAASNGSRIASLILRILTLILIIISLLIIATNSKTLFDETEDEIKFQFKEVYSYRYLFAAAVIGAVLSLIQITLNIYHVVTKSKGTPLFDSLSDKLLSCLLISGASAGLGAGIDLRDIYKQLFDNFFNSFFDKGNAASAILLGAFGCSAIVSILSTLALIKLIG